MSGEFNHTGDGACLDLLALDDSEKPDDGTLLLPLDGGGQPGQSEEASAKVLKLVTSMFKVEWYCTELVLLFDKFQYILFSTNNRWG